MIFQCPICNSMKENQNSFQITFFKDEDSIFHREECNVYQQFLNSISKKTSLNKKVVDVLYLTEGINKLFNIKAIYHIKNNCFYTTWKIPENIKYIDNYKKNIYYIFANFLEINSNYNFVIKNNHFEDIYLTNKNILIYLSQTHFETEILCLIEFNIQDTYPYDIDLLNTIEKSSLKENMSTFLYKCKEMENKQYFKKILNIKEEDICNIYQKIDIQIEKFKKESEEEIITLKENNKKYFERALLELELKEF